MKKEIKLLMLIIVVGVNANFNFVLGQSTITGNGLSGGGIPTPAEYLGSSNGYDVLFRANGTERMRILQSNGNVGIGITTPQNLLHQHLADNVNVFHQFTNGNTGSGSATTGFRIGLAYNSTSGLSDVTIRHFQENARMIFATTDAQGHWTRMRIENYIMPANPYSATAFTSKPLNRVGIFEEESINGAYVDQPPLALLYLGHHWSPSNGGHRSWMDIGSYISAKTDYMYVGTKNAYTGGTWYEPWSNWENAVISWGDNLNGPEGADDLEFIFTGPTGSYGHAGTWDGLEVGKFSPYGRLGIGNFAATTANGSGIAPRRRLEIYDEHLMDLGGGAFADAPQLRLTYTPNANINLGIHTDFQTTADGHLLIKTESSGTGKNVGINFTTATSPAPAQTLDVNGTAAIRAVNGPTNTLDKILVWNDANNGEIKYRDASSLGNVSACTTPAPADNLLTKWSPASSKIICNSIVYDDGDRVGVNTGNTLTASKFEVKNNNRIIGTASYSTSNTNLVNIGVFGYGQNATNANVGIVGNSPAQITFAGVPPAIVTSTGITLTTLPMNVGVIGRAQGNTYNFGGIFEANLAVGCPKMNIGVYASARKSCYTNFPQGGLAGYFNGGTWSTSSWQTVSDVRFKDSIQGVNNALEVIARLRPHSYVYKADSFPYMNLSLRKSFGFIAQEVDTVLPMLVHSTLRPPVIDTAGNILQDTMTIFGLNYTELIPFAIRAIQELDSLKVGTTTTKADSNHVVKWNTTDKTLVNSQIYDNGNRIGIPTVSASSFLNVFGHNDTITGNFTSDFGYATEVVNASYSTDGNPNMVVAVRGYSKYIDFGSDADGIGGMFEGGMYGSYNKASGTNFTEVGVVGEAENASGRNMGVVGVAHQEGVADNAGVMGKADSSETFNVGVLGVAEYVSTTSDNVGVTGFASGSDNYNIGGDFEATDAPGTNYGVFAYAGGSSPSYYAGYFDGDVHSTGTVTWASDGMLKKNVADMNPNTALAKLLLLQPKTYEFKRADYPYLSLPQGTQNGLIAQEVQQVFPELVKDIKQPERKDKDGKTVSPELEYKGLNYAGLIPVLVSAVKEQQTKIDSLEDVINTRLAEIEARLNMCCGSGKRDEGEGEGVVGDNTNNGTVNRLTVELSSMQVVVLEQNVPNPFAEQTSISYFIPENVSGAQLIFSDMMGNAIKTVEVKSGYGVVTVFASNLSTGQYSYSLLIDGKVAESKKMVKQR